jgi:hypothetical protein
MSEDVIQLNADGSGKKVRTLKRTVGANEVHEEVHNVADGAGNVIDPRKNVEVTGAVTANAGTNLNTSALATEATLGTVHGHVDSIDGKVAKCDTDNAKVVGDGRTYKRANGSCGASGNNTIVAAVAGKKIKVYDYSLQAQGAVTATFQDGAGGSGVSQPWKLQDREGKNKHGVPPGAPHDFETAAGNLLNLSLSATVTVGYEVVYTDADAA